MKAVTYVTALGHHVSKVVADGDLQTTAANTAQVWGLIGIAVIGILGIGAAIMAFAHKKYGEIVMIIFIAGGLDWWINNQTNGTTLLGHTLSKIAGS